MGISNSAKKAIKMGILFSIVYFIVYVSRNVLSAITPKLLENGYTENFIAKLSSLFFITYALGQLINGILGDKVKAKYMLFIGLLFSGIFQFVLPFVLENALLSVISYGISGFFLSMIYAPMVKVVAENNDVLTSSRISVAYNFSAYFGSPVAGLLSTFLIWQAVIYSSSIALIIMSFILLFFFFRFERSGIINYPEKENVIVKKSNYSVLFKRQIIKFSFVSIITGIVRTSVVFWLPTYINKYLNFSVETSTLIFTIISFILCISTFIALFLYERLRQNLNLSLFIAFVLSAVFFLLTFLIGLPFLNLIFISLAIIFSNCASSLMWNVYCPSLADTGLVSSATGYLDFLSYLAAAVANILFANAVSKIGWGNLIFVWLLLIIVGVIVCVPIKIIKKRKSTI